MSDKVRTADGEGGRPHSSEAKPSGAKLLKGAAVLGLATIVSKLLGTLQKIPLQNVAGDTVFGIYNAVYPLYILILFAATAGFPVAVSKFVAEQAAKGDVQGTIRIVAVSSLLLSGTGVILFILLYTGAGTIAAWIGISQTEKAIRSISYALLVSPVMAVLRGYFQGYQNMMPTAVSQVMEQLIRVITMVALLLYCMSIALNEEWIAAGATFGSVTGAVAGLTVMLVYWRRERRYGALQGGVSSMAASQNREGSPASDGEQARYGEGVVQRGYLYWAKRIAVYAIPICMGAIVVPILNLVDTFTMPRLLAAAVSNEAEAMRQFGLYNRGLPLVQLVVMIASSMSAILVPAIAAAKVQGEHLLVRQRAEMAVRLAWLIGLGASFGLAFAAVPINIMLYASSDASWTMAVLAFTALFSTLNAVTASVLQGAGAIRTPAKALLIATALKALGNVWLLPRWGIDGAALSAVIAYAAAAGLNLVQLVRCTGARFPLRQYAMEAHGGRGPHGRLARSAAALGQAGNCGLACAGAMGLERHRLNWRSRRRGRLRARAAAQRQHQPRGAAADAGAGPEAGAGPGEAAAACAKRAVARPRGRSRSASKQSAPSQALCP
ncbi:putative polysaccharide biosynthesis protein [Paenibacillus hexagrammi]|uniref:Polysaccharide biosynthesis protein n=1 Tax=Paenibacillus hexagrammi TaxID=2908839 RepID=A0ABY3SGQ2_9BACL|nr:oligosaccharide flippase family protein [Paenibacillus sp. YPD9-1]UJF33116.1 polysaccharide biosynthesis protein [Paenibacillus sp. YPD9-1]